MILKSPPSMMGTVALEMCVQFSSETPKQLLDYEFKKLFIQK